MADARMKVSQMGNVLITDDYDIMNVVTYNSQSQTYTSGKANVKVLKDYMIGDNDISALGDGSVTGAILELEQESETADSNIAETMAENGAHNLLYNRTSGSSVVGGLTMTTNGDKSITVGSGTTTSDDAIMLSGSSQAYSASEQTLKKGTYTASINGGTVPVYLIIKVEDDGAHGEQSIVVTGSGTNTFTIDADCRIFAYLYINASGQTSTGGVLYPMIKRASDLSTTYAPYAMTNEELTDVCIHKDLAWEITATDMSDFLNHICSKAYYDIGFVRDGDSFTGTAVWSGNNYFSFIVRREQAALYEIMAWRDAAFYTGRYIPNTSFVAFEYTGTQI